MSTNEQIQKLIDPKKREIERLREENKSIKNKRVKGFNDDKTIKENEVKIKKLELEVLRLEEQKK